MIVEWNGWQQKWWWLVDMMSARSVFHSKVWYFNLSGTRYAVLPSLVISPLTLVLFVPVSEITKKFTAHLVSKIKINSDLSLNTLHNAGSGHTWQKTQFRYIFQVHAYLVVVTKNGLLHINKCFEFSIHSVLRKFSIIHSSLFSSFCRRASWR